MSAFLIRHKTYGDILIDTGFDSTFYNNPPYGNLPFLATFFMTEVIQEENQGLELQLKNLDANINKVFFTHLHPDHTAGVPMLDPNIQYIVNKDEINFPTRAMFYGSHLADLNRLYTLNFDNAKIIEPLIECIDVLGDGSLWAISTPGHTNGHISYLVNATSGPLLLTGDAAGFIWGFENLMYNPIDVDEELGLETRKMLLNFINEYPEVDIFVGHELPK